LNLAIYMYGKNYSLNIVIIDIFISVLYNAIQWHTVLIVITWQTGQQCREAFWLVSWLVQTLQYVLLLDITCDLTNLQLYVSSD